MPFRETNVNSRLIKGRGFVYISILFLAGVSSHAFTASARTADFAGGVGKWSGSPAGLFDFTAIDVIPPLVIYCDPITCLANGYFILEGEDGSGVEARVSCVEVEGKEAFLGIWDPGLNYHAVYARDQAVSTGGDLLNLIANRQFDCLDSVTRAELVSGALPIEGDIQVRDSG